MYRMEKMILMPQDLENVVSLRGMIGDHDLNIWTSDSFVAGAPVQELLEQPQPASGYAELEFGQMGMRVVKYIEGKKRPILGLVFYRRGSNANIGFVPYESLTVPNLLELVYNFVNMFNDFEFTIRVREFIDVPFLNQWVRMAFHPETAASMMLVKQMLSEPNTLLDMPDDVTIRPTFARTYGENFGHRIMEILDYDNAVLVVNEKYYAERKVRISKTNLKKNEIVFSINIKGLDFSIVYAHPRKKNPFELTVTRADGSSIASDAYVSTHTDGKFPRLTTLIYDLMYACTKEDFVSRVAELGNFSDQDTRDLITLGYGSDLASTVITSLLILPRLAESQETAKKQN